MPRAFWVRRAWFDTGNAVICLGGAYSVASMVKEGKRFSPLAIVKKLLRSMPFCTYFLMIVLALAHLSLPGPVVEFAGILADANAFMAMLMLGVGFRLSGSREQLLDILRILGARYAVAAAAALACYFLLPLALEYRQALALLVFSPISSVAPAFTSELKGDVGLASAINSVSVLVSIVCIVAVLTLVL